MLVSQPAVYQPQTVVWMLNSQPAVAGVHVRAHEKLGQSPHSHDIASVEDLLTFCVSVVEAQIAVLQVRAAPPLKPTFSIQLMNLIQCLIKRVRLMNHKKNIIKIIIVNILILFMEHLLIHLILSIDLSVKIRALIA